MLLGWCEYADFRTHIDLRNVCFYFDRRFPVGATIEAADGQLHQASSTNLSHYSHVDKHDKWAPANTKLNCPEGCGARIHSALLLDVQTVLWQRVFLRTSRESFVLSLRATLLR